MATRKYFLMELRGKVSVSFRFEEEQICKSNLVKQFGEKEIDHLNSVLK